VIIEKALFVFGNAVDSIFDEQLMDRRKLCKRPHESFRRFGNGFGLCLNLQCSHL